MTAAPCDITLSAVPASGPGRAGKYLVTATRGDAELHRDVLDLNSERSRKLYVGAAMRAAFRDVPPDDWPGGVRDKLGEQLLAFARVPPGSPAPPPRPAAAEYVDPRLAPLADTPPDVRAAAEALLLDPALPARVAADVEAAGVAGERRAVLLLYLAGVSSQLPRPFSVIVQGVSASGKSFLVSAVADLFPPEVVLRATSLTTNALYYFEPDTLRHRWVVAGERSRVQDDDQAETTRALREMIEAGRLTKAVPVKDETGRYVTRLIEQEGPISFTETTTLGRIFEEDRNRCLVVGTDEQEEQTRRVLKATAARAEGRGRTSGGRAAVHHALVRMLPRIDVVVPFASALQAAYPADRVDARRSFRQVLQLIQASALLHHRQRNRAADGAAVADLRDYEFAAQLAAAPLALTRGGASDGCRRFLTALAAAFPKDMFSSKEAEQNGRWGRSTVRGWLNELCEAGAVEQTEQAKGPTPARWKVTGKDLPEPTGGLPTVEELSRLVRGGRSDGSI